MKSGLEPVGTQIMLMNGLPLSASGEVVCSQACFFGLNLAVKRVNTIDIGSLALPQESLSIKDLTV